MQALGLANQVRSRHAGWKRRLREREATLVDVMGDPAADSMKVLDVLVALPWIGRVRANQAMRQAGVSPLQTLGSLTYRQRCSLARLFPSSRRRAA